MVTTSPAEADALMADGEVQFVIEIPHDFSRAVVRGEVVLQGPADTLSEDAVRPLLTV